MPTELGWALPRAIQNYAVQDLALGYSPDGWRQLEADLRSQHLSEGAVLGERTPVRQKYAIRATLVGPSGSSADITSVWIVRTGEDIPRFVTAYPEDLR